jgi:hypothetical protein
MNKRWFGSSGGGGGDNNSSRRVGGGAAAAAAAALGAGRGAVVAMPQPRHGVNGGSGSRQPRVGGGVAVSGAAALRRMRRPRRKRRRFGNVPVFGARVLVPSSRPRWGAEQPPCRRSRRCQNIRASPPLSDLHRRTTAGDRGLVAGVRARACAHQCKPDNGGRSSPALQHPPLSTHPGGGGSTQGGEFRSRVTSPSCWRGGYWWPAVNLRLD